MSIALLPDFPLQHHSFTAQQFLALGIHTYRDAAYYVHSLPYRRNSNRGDFTLVLNERHGTCSTKHALLVQIAHDHDQPVDLLLGMYEMNEDNTPGVGAVLQRYGIDALPEAHCCLLYKKEHIDITRQHESPARTIHFLVQEVIQPSQIGEYKVSRHHSFLLQWCAATGLNFESVWNIREECIATLSL